MEVVVVQGDLSRFSADALVNAASTSLEMNGGVAAALRKHGGKDIEEEALESAPLEKGQAVATSAGKLDAKFVVHAAAIDSTGSATVDSVKTAFRNALELADSLECETLAVPAIGAGAGGFALEQSAELLLKETVSFGASSIKTVFFVLHSPEAFVVFEKKARELNVSLTDWKAFEARINAENKKREEDWNEPETRNEPTAGTDLLPEWP